jgi:hypothetical protein
LLSEPGIGVSSVVMVASVSLMVDVAITRRARFGAASLNQLCEKYRTTSAAESAKQHSHLVS